MASSISESKFDVDDIFEDVSDVAIASKGLDKLKANIQKDGFRTGLSVGQEGEIQASFNQAFSQSTVLLQSVSRIRGQICAYLSLNHLNSAEQKMITDDAQNKLEELLQEVQAFEHTCLELSDERGYGELEAEVKRRVREFKTRLEDLTQKRLL